MHPPAALHIAASLFLLAAATGVTQASSQAPAAPARRNVILILIDDMGWRDLGCAGSRFYETPNLDALAARGVRFTHAYSAAPVCSTTRASLLTGKYPARLGLTDWLPGRRDMPSQKLLRPPLADHLPLAEVTLAEALKSAGYRTAHLGKWHLGGLEHSPEKQGFDPNLGGTATGSPPGGYIAFRTPTLELAPGEYLTDRLASEAEKFIEASDQQPFFLYMPHYAVHIPLQAKEELVARYRDRMVAGEPQSNAIYAAMIQSVDESVGRIVRKLAALGLTERTLILFTSDNGGLSVREGPNTPATSNAPLRAGKGYLYEGGIRVPMIAAGPGIGRGVTCAEPVISADLYPTLVEIAGARPPGGKAVDGVSLLPLLTGTSHLRRTALYWHYPHYSNQGGRPSGAVRAGNLKLVEHFEDNRVELFDLSDDPGETTDLAGTLPEDAARLRRMLAEWRRSVGARMPAPNPDYRPPAP